MNISVKMNRPAARRVSAAVPLAIMAALLFVGCGYARQVREDVPPRAVPAARLAQTLNPDAGKNRKVVAGLDGEAAKNTGAAYAKSFGKESKQADPSTATSGL